MMLKLTHLDVAARLALVMKQQGSERVAREIGEPKDRLLRMIELKTPFNRKVLRYLSLRREESYLLRPSASPDGCAT